MLISIQHEIWPSRNTSSQLLSSHKAALIAHAAFPIRETKRDTVKKVFRTFRATNYCFSLVTSFTGMPACIHQFGKPLRSGKIQHLISMYAVEIIYWEETVFITKI